MLDTFLKLTDKIVQLLKEKQYRKDKVFKDIIDPIFKNLEPVAKDYFIWFDEILKYISTPEAGQKNKDIVDSFRRRRMECLHLRIEIRNMADLIMSEFTDEDIQCFVKHILKFFSDISVFTKEGDCIFEANDDDEYSSLSLRIVKYIAAVEFNNYPKERFIKLVNATIESLEMRWNAITKQYSILRIKYLKP